MTSPDRPELLRALAELVRGVGWASERVGHSFASSQGLHPTDLRALTAIYAADLGGAPLTVRELAQRLDLTPAAITYAVDRLTATGHVWRERGVHDRRTVVLRFGDHGRQVARDFFTPLGAMHNEALENFSDADLTACVRVLGVVNEALARFDRELREPGALQSPGALQDPGAFQDPGASPDPGAPPDLTGAPQDPGAPPDPGTPHDPGAPHDPGSGTTPAYPSLPGRDPEERL